LNPKKYDLTAGMLRTARITISIPTKTVSVKSDRISGELKPELKLLELTSTNNCNVKYPPSLGAYSAVTITIDFVAGSRKLIRRVISLPSLNEILTRTGEENSKCVASVQEREAALFFILLGNITFLFLLFRFCDDVITESSSYS